MKSTIGDQAELINMATTVGHLIGLWRVGEHERVAQAVAGFSPEDSRLALLTSINVLALAKMAGEQ